MMMVDGTIGDDPYAVRHLQAGPEADSLNGKVVWDPIHSLWNSAMLLGGVAAVITAFSWSGVVVFLGVTSLTLLIGHSVGFHRRLIHGSFKAPLWLDRLMMWLGTLVGICGPLSMIHAHELRDWGQRQAHCHPYLSNQAGFWRDYAWNLHGRFKLVHPPVFAPAGGIGQDCFYLWLERTWMLQQVPVVMLLLWLGGVEWVLWGVCARVCLSATAHWWIGRLAHRQGPQSWIVESSGVQAHDVPWAAIPTMGEAWHNNHHAYPASAKLGLYPGQSDLGFAFIRLLERLGLAWDIRTPDNLPAREALFPVEDGRAKKFTCGNWPGNKVA